MLVSVVIPLYNEEAGLEALSADVEIMRQSIAAIGHSVEVIFVDDGSNDGTTWNLSILFRTRQDVRVVAHKRNRGFGAALRSGIRNARGAVILACDGDRPYPPGDASLLVEAVQGPEDADVSTVSPWGSGGRADDVPGHRRLLSRGASLLYRLALGKRAGGLTCFTATYRGYKADVLRTVEFRSDDFLANAEILVRLLVDGRRAIEIPAALSNREMGTSKMRVARTIRRHLGLLWRIVTGGLDDWRPKGSGAPV